jgi:hypothetical protein
MCLCVFIVFSFHRESFNLILIDEHLILRWFCHNWCVHDQHNCPIYMDDTDAFRLQHGKKVSFFYCHPIFLPSNHPFSNDTRSFLKCKTVRKGTPKRKLIADIMERFDDVKELENGMFEGYGENHNWTHKSCL